MGKGMVMGVGEKEEDSRVGGVGGRRI